MCLVTELCSSFPAVTNKQTQRHYLSEENMSFKTFMPSEVSPHELLQTNTDIRGHEGFRFSSSECIFAVISAVKMKLGKYPLEIWHGKIIKYLHRWLLLWYFRHIFVNVTNALKMWKEGKLCLRFTTLFPTSLQQNTELITKNIFICLDF